VPKRLGRTDLRSLPLVLPVPYISRPRFRAGVNGIAVQDVGPVRVVTRTAAHRHFAVPKTSATRTKVRTRKEFSDAYS